jgi:hypothetical protein
MTAHSNFWPLFFMFILPLSLAMALLIAAFRLRRKWARITSGIVGLLFLLAFGISVVQFAPYAWALHLESKWTQAQPSTKAQLESLLSLYSQHDIQPTQSLWGHDHELHSGERMVQYLLLWREPLDVVYSTNDRIVAIYTSYE